ncbi:UNVERIFIED_CONTAM: hypothetical protein FKN15_003766 [Acipenser sinensis]
MVLPHPIWLHLSPTMFPPVPYALNLYCPSRSHPRPVPNPVSVPFPFWLPFIGINSHSI